ncbi:MAG: nitroreductase family protein [Dehalococcoidia bacterium]
MEFKEVIGTRRSIRYFEPDKPVEREKIQMMLEAARLASCAVNAHWMKAIVVDRDAMSKEQLDSLKTPVASTALDLAPVHIYIFMDLSVVNQIKGSRLKELVDAGALNPTHGWSHEFVDTLVYPQILKPLTELDAYPVAAAADCGMAAGQALLMAFDLGLGAILNTPTAAAVTAAFNAPAEWVPLWVILVGYPAEDINAGGQRPRPPFEEQYFEGTYGTPFKRDQGVVEQLKKEKMIQDPAPLPGRKEEIKKLAERFGLPM